MTIEGDEPQYVAELDQVAVFDTKVYGDSDGVWRTIRHPVENLVLRVKLGEESVFELYNHKQREVLHRRVVEVSGEPAAVFKNEIESIYNDWREIVL